MIAPEAAVDLAPELTSDGKWLLTVDGYDPLRVNSLASRFAISNGFLGVRGAWALILGGSWILPACTYVAGLFDIPDDEQTTRVLVQAPGWVRLKLTLPGGPLVDHNVPPLRTVLDMQRGALLGEFNRLKGPDLCLRLRARRFVSLSERAVGVQLIEVEIEEGEVEVTLESSLDGLSPRLAAERLDQDLCVWRTLHSGKRLAMATASLFQLDGHDLLPTVLNRLSRSWTWKTRPGQAASFERIVAMVRSDSEAFDPGPVALEKLDASRRLGWQGVKAAHEAAWQNRWSRSHVEVEGDSHAQQALRFALYHLNSAANPGDDRVSIGARALTGDGYNGHVFWDAEIYLLPFYILTWPEAARAMLMYRFHTLDGARAKAARLGCRGALYAWESADTGAETTPPFAIAPDRRIIPIRTGAQEQHISADIAYGVWNYWLASGDDRFLCDAGAEIILETARFWSSRAELETDGRYHIRGVIGPDEYHENVDDSAYTNVMARWNIRRALDVAALLQERWPNYSADLSTRLDLREPELKQWRRVAETIATGLDPKTGLIEQFEGYFELEKIDLTSYAGRSVPMDVVLGRERTQESQVIRQADVVALLGLLPEEFAEGAAAENFGYYEPRCGHGSSLSPAMHGLVAARLGYGEKAMDYFRAGALIDLSDTHAAIDSGVHIGALGGNWMLVVFGFGGLSLQSDGISLDPKLPAAWRNLAFPIQWRRRCLNIKIEQNKQRLEAILLDGEPMTLTVRGKPFELRPNQMLEVCLAARTS
ncbi:MAG: glycosyl hydrolase family 65 protein [Rhodomicrobium sp.]